MVILIYILKPSVIWTKVAPKKNTVAVLVDRSKSMNTMEGSIGRMRSQLAYEVVTEELQKNLSEKYELKFYGFSKDCEEMSESNLGIIKKADGKFTAIGDTFAFVSEVAKYEPIHSVVFLSDGSNNYGMDPFKAIDILNTPVYAIGVGKEGGVSKTENITIESVETNAQCIVNSLLDVHVVLRNRGSMSASATVELLENGIHPVDKVIVNFSPNTPIQKVKLKLIASKVGKFKYFVRISDDVQKSFPLNVKNIKIRVLYIEGAPRWEYKFLRRALQEDSNIELTCFLRLAGNKMYQQDTGVSGNAPFPQNLEDFSRYDAIILGDIERNFFTDRFLSDLSIAVSERGIGLVILAGLKSLSNGEYDLSPLSSAIPVVIGNISSRQIKSDFRLELTNEGETHPIFRWSDKKDENKRYWENLPGWSNCVRTLKPKLSTNILAVYPSKSEANKIILVAVGPYGKGRSMIITTDTMWKWAVDLKGAKIGYEKFWGQSIRWMSAWRIENKDVEAVRLSTSKDVLAKFEPVEIAAKISDKEGKPLTGVSVSATIKTPKGVVEQLPIVKSPGSLGKYSITYVPEDVGNYEISVSAKEGAKILGEDDCKIIVSGQELELKNVDFNKEFLKSIAKESGGEYFNYDEISKLVFTIKESKRIIAPVKKEHKIGGLFLILCFTGLVSIEWILRRQKDIL
ncbi:MAG: hypothetical protein AABY84_11125 [Candidatus Firestonebacteria bacterium]